MICKVCPFRTLLDVLAKTLTLLLSDSEREHTGNTHTGTNQEASVAP